MANNYLRGVLGFKGERGYSAYEVAVRNGYKGSEKDWLATLGTTSHFDKKSEIYTATAGQTEFNLPGYYTSNSFIDVYVEGEHLDSTEYTLTDDEITLTNAITVEGTKVEIIILTMSTNNLPIVEKIDENSTNDEVLGAKSLYETLSDNVKNHGAKGDGVTDDTEAFTNCFNSNKKFICIPTGTYKIGNIETSEGQTIIFEDCTFVRKVHEGGALIKTGDNCVLMGNLKIDGDKANYVANNEVGIEFGSDNLVYARIESYNNGRHGIMVGSNTYANCLIAHDNGVEGTIQADGIYVRNANDTIIEHCKTYNNTRIGLTVTTYDETTSTMNKELSKNVNVKSIISYDNGYIDIDFEGIQDARLSNVRGNGKVCGSESANCTYQDLEISSFYADNSNYYTVKKAGVSPTGAASQVFYIGGYEINVEDVTIHDTADSYGSNTFQITDTKERAIVKNIHIKNGNNACVITGCYEAKNILVEKCNNRKYTIDGRLPSDNNFEIERGLLKALFTHKPNTGYGYQNGTYKKCDTVYNSTLRELGEAGSMYVIEKWVCRETGSNNADNWIEYRSLTGN